MMIFQKMISLLLVEIKIDSFEKGSWARFKFESVILHHELDFKRIFEAHFKNKKIRSYFSVDVKEQKSEMRSYYTNERGIQSSMGQRWPVLNLKIDVSMNMFPPKTGTSLLWNPQHLYKQHPSFFSIGGERAKQAWVAAIIDTQTQVKMFCTNEDLRATYLAAIDGKFKKHR
jgi:hypothetical protein